jgi:hypothetical protein
MRTMFLALAALTGMGLLAGCQGPRLEPRSLTAAEAHWARTVKRWYPAWEPPYLSPLRNPPPQTPEDNGSGPDVETVPASDRDPDLSDTPAP